MSKTIPIEYNGPYGGLNVQTPENLIDKKFSPGFSNFNLRNAELRSRPALLPVIPSPDGTNPVLGFGTFIDQTNTPHTWMATTRGMWQLNGVNTQAPYWTFLGAIPVNSGTPISSQIFLNIIYGSNGAPNVFFWDGINNNAQTLNTTVIQQFLNGSIPQISGSIGGLFVYELNDSIQIANTVEVVPAAPGTASTATQIMNFPYRVRWSANGIPNVWDPSVNTTAGFNDLLEVPDAITGVLAIGSQVAYIFRTNGITEQTITGSAVLPFTFNHLWASQRGIGNAFQFSIAGYGSVGFFISNVNVYQVSIYSFEEVGAGARDAIFSDLYAATATPVAKVVDQYVGGYVYLTYKILIPLGTFTRIWSYSLEDKSWEPETFTGVLPTCAPTFAWR